MSSSVIEVFRRWLTAQWRGKTVLRNSSSAVNLYTCLSTSNRLNIPHFVVRRLLKDTTESLQKHVNYIIITPL